MNAPDPVDIIEAAQASHAIREIRELNVGSYVCHAPVMFAALQRMAKSGLSEGIRLTDTVHQLLRAGHKVASYSSYDPDEILGINTPQDLAQAKFILQKRYLRPLRSQEQNEILFGTGGWRAVIGLDNYERVLVGLHRGSTRH